MARNAFLTMAILAGSLACSSSGGNGTGTTGGNFGTCTSADYTPGTCTWPDFCLGGHCTTPQNLSQAGADTPASACTTSKSTLQGQGNLDTVRADAGFDQLLPNSPIITDLAQITIEDNSGCAAAIGQNSVEFEESASACKGGNTDRAGQTICATGEAAMMFQGHVFDPQGHFATKEGDALNAQFNWLIETDAGVTNFLGSAYGAGQSGFVILPEGDAGAWTASGGAVVLVQCLGPADYPLIPNAFPNTLHFASTGVGDAGVPGNSFCVPWKP